MIVDTSALAAIAQGEPHWEELRAAVSSSPLIIPASAMVELELVMARRDRVVLDAARALVARLVEAGAAVASFDKRYAELAAIARDRYGKGNGRGGLLNFGDLMVYAVAKDVGEPLLCTGRDFAATDLDIHPASRLSP